MTVSGCASSCSPGSGANARNIAVGGAALGDGLVREPRLDGEALPFAQDRGRRELTLCDGDLRAPDARRSRRRAKTRATDVRCSRSTRRQCPPRAATKCESQPSCNPELDRWHEPEPRADHVDFDRLRGLAPRTAGAIDLADHGALHATITLAAEDRPAPAQPHAGGQQLLV
jgi:hypothetical protein